MPATPESSPLRRLLLISNSTLHGSGYLDHAEARIRAFLGDTPRILFVPYALADRDRYARQARERFAKMGIALDSVHDAADPRQAVLDAPALFVGGGNTFRLLKALQDLGLAEPIRRRAAEGMPYIGSSAGSIVSCPTIRTTNDMPIVEPSSFQALGLIAFQVNAHYLDPDPRSKHMGETREVRLLQFHEENDLPVVGLREGTMLRIEARNVLLQGITAARIFRRGREPVEVSPEAVLNEYLEPGPGR
jgi:dipeptidase E